MATPSWVPGNADLPFTRSTASSSMRASCTDDTGHRADVTRRAGIIRQVVPRTVPCPRPGRPIILLQCVTSLRAQYPCLRSDRLIGPTVFKSVRGSLSFPTSTWTFSICAAMSAKIIPCISHGTAPDVWHGRSGAGCEKLTGVQVMAERAGVRYQRAPYRDPGQSP